MAKPLPQKLLPQKTQVVIIGGGIHGCSVAYHLAKAGWKDVVLLERKQLTSGTTWHAAGLVGRLHGGHATTAFSQYGVDLYAELERETGQATGFQQCGSIAIASRPERMRELRRQADFALLNKIEAQELSVEEILERWPLMNPEGVLGGIHVPSNGYINPIDLTMALAKGARIHGAQLFEHTKVLDVVVTNGMATGVITEQGLLEADFVVNCAGMWARELGRQSGVHVATHACEHYYLVTDVIEGLAKDLPVLRAYDDCTYFKQDAGKLLFGFAHNKVKPWGMEGIDEEFSFDSLPFVDDDVMDVLEMAMNRVPALETAGIRTFFNGPESYSYDGNFTLGEAPEVKNYFVLAGVNSTGIQSGAGAGRALAQWIMQGYAPMDLNDMDPARIQTFQAQDSYLQARAPETETRTYAMHWPNYQRDTVRQLRKTPFYHTLKQHGAWFAEQQGWERPAWFAPKSVTPETDYSFHRPKWFDYAQAEQQAARHGVALLDYSMLGKLWIEGIGAEQFLQRMCTNNMAMKLGQVVYTLMLNERGGIESDITVARFENDKFLLMSSMARTRRDQLWLQKHVLPQEDVRLQDATSAYGVLSIVGPKSRELMASLTATDVSNSGFPFGTWQNLYVGHAPCWAQRVSFTGELGWEIYVTPDFADYILQVLIDNGQGLGLRLMGGEALNALRIEKGYLHWGHDLSYTDAPHQLGLEFLCKTNKVQHFVGQRAYEQRRAEAKGPYLCHLTLADNLPMLHHNEAVLRDGEIVGFVTSGAYAQHSQRSVGLCVLELPQGSTNKQCLEDGSYTVLIEGEEYAANVSLKSAFDPLYQKLRS